MYFSLPFLILIPGNVVKSGFCSFLFLTPFRNLQILCEVAKLKLVSILMFKSVLHHNLLVHLWQKSHIFTLGLGIVSMTENHLAVGQIVQQILRRKKAMGTTFLMSCSLLLQCVLKLCRMVLFHNFGWMERCTF